MLLKLSLEIKFKAIRLKKKIKLSWKLSKERMDMSRKLELGRKLSSHCRLKLNNNKKWSKKHREEPDGVREG